MILASPSAVHKWKKKTEKTHASERKKLDSKLPWSRHSWRAVWYLADKTPRGRLWSFGRGVGKVVTDTELYVCTLLPSKTMDMYRYT